MTTLFIFSMGMIPFGALVILIGVLGMLSNRKDNKSRNFKEMKKLTLIGLAILCIGFGVSITILMTVPIY